MCISLLFAVHASQPYFIYLTLFIYCQVAEDAGVALIAFESPVEPGTSALARVAPAAVAAAGGAKKGTKRKA